VTQPEKKTTDEDTASKIRAFYSFSMLIVSGEKQFFLGNWFSNLKLDTKKLSN
jgi:hypothetical protein